MRAMARALRHLVGIKDQSDDNRRERLRLDAARLCELEIAAGCFDREE